MILVQNTSIRNLRVLGATLQTCLSGPGHFIVQAQVAPGSDAFEAVAIILTNGAVFLRAKVHRGYLGREIEGVLSRSGRMQKLTRTFDEVDWPGAEELANQFREPAESMEAFLPPHGLAGSDLVSEPRRLQVPT